MSSVARDSGPLRSGLIFVESEEEIPAVIEARPGSRAPAEPPTPRVVAVPPSPPPPAQPDGLATRMRIPAAEERTAQEPAPTGSPPGFAPGDSVPLTPRAGARAAAAGV